MNSAPLESTIQASIGKRLKKMGAWYQKNAPGPWGYTKGRLDFTVIYKGRGIALEVKRPGPRHFSFVTLVDEYERSFGNRNAASFLNGPDCAHCWKECTLPQQNQIKAVRSAGGVAQVVTSADEAQAVLEATDLR